MHQISCFIVMYVEHSPNIIFYSDAYIPEQELTVIIIFVKKVCTFNTAHN